MWFRKKTPPTPTPVYIPSPPPTEDSIELSCRGVMMDSKQWYKWVPISDDIEVMVRALDAAGSFWVRKRVVDDNL